MRVLFCTDGSDASYYALNKSLPFINKESSVIDILHIIDWGFIPTTATFAAEEVFPGYKEVATKILDKSESIIVSDGFKVGSREYQHGKTAGVILDRLKSKNYDLVVMGSHGKKGFQNWLGSVSRRVVYKSQIPVFIARPPKEIVVKPRKLVVVSCDGSKNSYNAIETFINLCNLESTDVDIITVRTGVETLPLEITMDNEWLERSLEKQKELAEEVLNEAEGIFIKNNKQIVRYKKSLEGNSAEEILNYANENNPDLIVMGSHGREGLSDVLLGSVSKRVLDNSYYPVLIIPKKSN